MMHIFKRREGLEHTLCRFVRKLGSCETSLFGRYLAHLVRICRYICFNSFGDERKSSERLKRRGSESYFNFAKIEVNLIGMGATPIWHYSNARSILSFDCTIQCVTRRVKVDKLKLVSREICLCDVGLSLSTRLEEQLVPPLPYFILPTITQALKDNHRTTKMQLKVFLLSIFTLLGVASIALSAHPHSHLHEHSHSMKAQKGKMDKRNVPDDFNCEFPSFFPLSMASPTLSRIQSIRMVVTSSPTSSRLSKMDSLALLTGSTRMVSIVTRVRLRLEKESIM